MHTFFIEGGTDVPLFFYWFGTEIGTNSNMHDG